MSEIYVTRPSLPPMEEYVAAVKEIWHSRILTNMGSYHEKFASALKSYLGAENISLFTNGHMSLELSIQALGLTGEVITTPFTFASTTHAIVRNGLTPVFCDIDPGDFTLDPNRIESLITPKTSAIIPVHVYGNVCHVDEIADIAKRHNLKVLYDAAHAFGVRYKGKSTAVFGDVACFSFHATKVFHSIEGGAASFSDPELKRRLYHLKNFGISGPENVDSIGANAKLNEFCAAMGLINLRYLPEEIAARGRIAAVYRKMLGGVEGIMLAPAQEGVTPNYAYFPVVFDEAKFGAGRDEVFKRLSDYGIHARKYFYPLTSAFECYRGVFGDADDTPAALDVSRKVLTLPLYSGLGEDRAEMISSIVVGCRKRSRL